MNSTDSQFFGRGAILFKLSQTRAPAAGPKLFESTAETGSIRPFGRILGDIADKPADIPLLTVINDGLR